MGCALTSEPYILECLCNVASQSQLTLCRELSMIRAVVIQSARHRWALPLASANSVHSLGIGHRDRA